MKVYLSGPQNRVDEIRVYAQDLRDMGHTVISFWHEPSELKSSERAHLIIQTVRDANIFIGFTEHGGPTREDRHAEFALAVAASEEAPLSIFLIGEPEMVLHHLGWVQWFHSFDALLEGYLL